MPGLDFFFSIDFLFFNLILLCNYFMDSIEHKYGASIFYQWKWLRETKFFGYREFWKHDWTRKWIGGDPANGRKKKWGIVVPVFFLDGWHFWKGWLITGIVLLISKNIWEFGIAGLWWLLIWYFIYDRYYND